MNAHCESPRYGKVFAIPAALGLTCLISAGAERVDWLEFSPVGNASGFFLRDDSGTSLVEGSLATQRGTVFSGFPSARTFSGEYWQGSTGFTDSLSGNALVHATAFRVAAPSGGPASYTIELDIPENREILLMVGDLYHGSDISRTAGVNISARSDSSVAGISLEGIWGWDNGISRMSDDLAWMAGVGTLSTVTGATGESKAAFFRIDPVSGTNARLVLGVPDGLAGTGDTIMVALGVVVPEPSATLLGLSGGAALLLGRRRVTGTGS
ncbi:hypothetical protein OVA24_14265 [Luteolibacter sp. SL250]|uniref:hypothetical protein n=1 Tax=Luteolibacter sp. SL250 TaxID=2995170 RepID=UPI00226F3E3B|nr:hypothetical protein [Luteolibacter sp. SL250]WAC18396.1 hypothetical protein OVA24_14265 [Luteolibacter sp. SL250]